MKRVQNSLQRTNLLTPKSRILVAASGGPDSMALLYTLNLLQKKFHWELAVAHVNYNLRGSDSKKDAALVKEIAEALKIPLYTLEKKSLSNKSEAALRTLRYDFFEKIAEEKNFDLVALAHHQDDQAETVLLRLLRGSGTLGLSGMRAKRGIFVRPFLYTPKSEILAFLQEKDIPYRLDKSNEENLYLRNKIRNVVLPLLETYNPNMKRTLATTADTLQKEQSDAREITPFPVHIQGAHVSLSRELWQSYSPYEQVAFLRRLFRHMDLSMPTKNLAGNVVKDLAAAPKKGFVKDYSRLRLQVNNDMIDIHFKELD